MHTDAHLSIPSHRYTLACKSIHTRMREGMAAAKRTWSRRCACVRASIQGVRTCLHAQASMQAHICTDRHTTFARAHAHAHTHTPMESTCTLVLIHMYSYMRTQMYVQGDTRDPSRGRARVPLLKRARTHVRTSTRTCVDSARTHICIIIIIALLYRFTHIYICTCTFASIY